MKRARARSFVPASWTMAILFSIWPSNFEAKADAGLGDTYLHEGQYRESISRLNAALHSARENGNDSKAFAIQCSLGVAHTFLREFDRAQVLLEECLAIARHQNDLSAQATLQNNLGNLHLAARNLKEAARFYEDCIESARKAGDVFLSAQGLANAALTALESGALSEAERFGMAALRELDTLEPASREGLVYASVGKTFLRVAAVAPDSRERLLPQAYRALDRSRAIAEGAGEARAKSYALAYQAQLYQLEGRLPEAHRLTRQAVFAAQQAGAADALYQWEWQAGRLLRDMGERDAAIAACQRAVQSLQEIRNDLVLGYGNGLRTGSFRETTGALYFELADLLLERAGHEQDPRQVESVVIQARDTIELLRSAEMEDYFQDECVNLARARTAPVESLSPQTALIYYVPLAERLEILLGLAGKWKRFKVPVGEAELARATKECRALLEKRTTCQYLGPARQLYQWLIAPLVSELKANSIDTLVFVPDGALRLIPMAALHDGDNFLASQFAIAITPGLTLMDPRPLKQQGATILMSALSQPVQGFPALYFVSEEIQTVENNYTGKTLFNDTFSIPNVENTFKQGSYSMVHFASHGQFDRDPKKSFLLSFDGKMTMDDLEKLIRPNQFRGQPVELLILSACQTAAGDDRSALGLAGAAIKAGARSALATIWFVNDQATSLLVSEFYSEMRRHPARSKAKALQAAQRTLLEDPRFRHPCYWSPYLIIGNWL